MRRQRGFLLNPFRFGVSGGFFYTPSTAYSTRKRITGYAGSCIRVRRASDNTEQDIGFSGDWLDESAIASFCGASVGHVVTWYDQSGGGVNLTQATTGAQPTIYNGTTVYKIGTRPAINFDRAGTDQYLSAAANAAFGFGTAAYSLEMNIERGSADTTVTDMVLIDLRTAGGQESQYSISASDFTAGQNNRPYYQSSGSAFRYSGGTALTDDVLQNYAVCFNGGSSVKQFIGGSLVINTSRSPSHGSTRPLYVGANFAGGGGLDGKIGEVCIVLGTDVFGSGFTPDAF